MATSIRRGLRGAVTVDVSAQSPTDLGAVLYLDSRDSVDRVRYGGLDLELSSAQYAMGSGTLPAGVADVPLSCVVMVKPESLTSYQMIAGIFHATTGLNGFGIYWQAGGDVYATQTATGAYNSGVAGPIAADEWAVLGATWTSDTSRVAFVNGAPGANGSGDASAMVTPTRMGVGCQPSSGLPYKADGVVAYVAWWDRALSYAEHALIAEGLDPRDLAGGGPVLYHVFDEAALPGSWANTRGSGGTYALAPVNTPAMAAQDVVTWSDASGTDTIGGVRGGDQNLPAHSTALGAGSESVLFDDANSEWLSLNETLTAGEPLSIYAVVRSDDATSLQFVASQVDTGEVDVILALVLDGATAGDPVKAYAESPLGSSAATAGTFASGTTHLVSAVLASDTSRTASIDGTAGTEDTTDIAPGTFDRIAIGANGGATPASFFSGHILAVIAFDKVLSASDLAGLEAWTLAEFGVPA